MGRHALLRTPGEDGGSKELGAAGHRRGTACCAWPLLPPSLRERTHVFTQSNGMLHTASANIGTVRVPTARVVPPLLLREGPAREPKDPDMPQPRRVF